MEEGILTSLVLPQIIAALTFNPRVLANVRCAGSLRLVLHQDEFDKIFCAIRKVGGERVLQFLYVLFGRLFHKSLVVGITSGSEWGKPSQ